MEEQRIAEILERLSAMERRLAAVESKLAPAATQVVAGFELSFVDLRREIAEFNSAYPRPRNLQSTERHYRECLSELMSEGLSRAEATEFLRAKAVEYARSKEGSGQYARGSDVWLRERAFKEKVEKPRPTMFDF